MTRRSPLDFFFEHVNQRPDAVALRHKVGGAWREYSWREYGRLVKRAARALIALGVEPGARVVILGPNRPEWMLGALGAMAAGASAAGIYATSTAEQVAYIAHHADATVAIVHDAAQLAKFRAEKANLPHLQHYVLMAAQPSGPGEMTWDDFLKKGDAVDEKTVDERLAKIQPDDVASLIYTSGTTGNPKAVMITHRNCMFAAEACKNELGITPNEHMLSYLPLSHIAEQVLSVHGAAVIGCTVSFCEDLSELGNYLKDVHPTVFFGVPRVWEKMQAKMTEVAKNNSWLKKKIAAWARGVGLRAGYAKQKGEPMPFGYWLAKKLVFDKVRKALGMERAWFTATGAAPISKSTLEFFLSLDIPIYEVYGMSECTGPGTLSIPGAFRTGSVGKPVPGTEVKLAADGEILMRGPHVFKGYLKDPAATAESLDADGWLHSGDVGEIDAQGYLRITDRKKDLFKTAGGKYIAPQNLEALLKGIPGVAQAVVIGEGRKFAVALLTLDPEAANGRPIAELALDTATVGRIEAELAKINARLPPYETIKRVKVLPTEFTVESGELTPTMKLKRKVVNQRYASEIDALYAAPGASAAAE
jgi:long-subunit acyl-CoA synthetase (AMP-forming)